MGNSCYTDIGTRDVTTYRGMQLLPIFFYTLWRGNY